MLNRFSKLFSGKNLIFLRSPSTFHNKVSSALYVAESTGIESEVQVFLQNVMLLNNLDRLRLKIWNKFDRFDSRHYHAKNIV